MRDLIEGTRRVLEREAFDANPKGKNIMLPVWGFFIREVEKSPERLTLLTYGERESNGY